MSVIQANNLSKRYGRVKAVDRVSFDIKQGEIVGFLGPNGAGKTTTLRILAGLIRPSEGSSQILGQRVPSSSLLNVGTMIEEPAFYPYMTGWANLKHASLLHGGVSERRIDEMLEFVSMEKAKHKRVRAYSQGMRQRLGLARALLWRPKVLLLDEPTNGLDPVGIAEIRENLRNIAQQGVTILISSHILAEIEKLVQRILVIEKGKLLFDGPIEEITQRVEEQSLFYVIDSPDQAALMTALQRLELSPNPVDDDSVRVAVPLSLAPTLLRQVVLQGVDILEARREAVDLESGYLRLLKEDGRPS